MKTLRWVMTAPLIASTVIAGGLTLAAGIETSNWLLMGTGILTVGYVIVTVKRELNQTSD